MTGPPGSLGVTGRGSLISPGVAGRWALVGDPPDPANPKGRQEAWVTSPRRGPVSRSEGHDGGARCCRRVWGAAPRRGGAVCYGMRVGGCEGRRAVGLEGRRSRGCASQQRPFISSSIIVFCFFVFVDVVVSPLS